MSPIALNLPYPACVLAHPVRESVWANFRYLTMTSLRSDWVVLVSEVGERGLVARQAGRWAGRGREGRLETSRPLKPRYTNDFFGATLRVVSRRDTDKGM